MQYPAALDFRRLGMIALFGLSLFATASAAEDHWSDERFVLRAGAVFMDIDSSFRVDSRSLGRGTTVDAEGQLGLDDTDQIFRAELGWRFARRHQLNLGYYDLSRDANSTSNNTIQVGNIVFPAGAEVKTDFDLKLADLSYSYSLIQTDRFELAPLIGVYGIDFDVSVFSPDLNRSQDEGAQFPFPTGGVRSVYVLSPFWSIRARAQYFYFSYDDYEGQILDLGIGLEWKFHRRLSLGAGYSHIDLDVENEIENGGKGEYDYDGVWAYLGLNF